MQEGSRPRPLTRGDRPPLHQCLASQTQTPPAPTTPPLQRLHVPTSRARPGLRRPKGHLPAPPLSPAAAAGPACRHDLIGPGRLRAAAAPARRHSAGQHRAALPPGRLPRPGQRGTGQRSGSRSGAARARKARQQVCARRKPPVPAAARSLAPPSITPVFLLLPLQARLRHPRPHVPHHLRRRGGARARRRRQVRRPPAVDRRCGS